MLIYLNLALNFESPMSQLWLSTRLLWDSVCCSLKSWRRGGDVHIFPTHFFKIFKSNQYIYHVPTICMLVYTS